MTTIPVDLGWLILAGFILMPAMAYLASYEANRHATRHHRKHMEAREKMLNNRAAQAMKRDIAVREREEAVHERAVELGRKAHELATQTHVVLRQANSHNAVPELEPVNENL